MGKAKRLRKARMLRRQWAHDARLTYNRHPLIDVTAEFLLFWQKERRAMRRRHETLTGRNPKVLAKRRRQRERLALRCDISDLELKVCAYGFHLDPLVAEQLHAIAEGR